MTNKPRITLGLPDHPRCRAMIDGKVGVEGYELDIDPNFVSSGERHYKYLHGEWDVGECSAASLLRAIEKGQELLAIPVFFERGPRQRNIYHCEGRLKNPSELKGKKFGCFRYGATAVVWARGYLLDAHDIKTTTCNGSSPAGKFLSATNCPSKWSASIRRRLSGKRNCNSPKCSAKARCTAPSYRATQAIWDCSAAV